MNLLIRNAKIISRDKALHGKTKDILIKNGVIEKIATRISDNQAKIVSSPNLHISIGWMDIGTQIGEPGFEHRETIRSVSKAAASGGFTAIAPFPNTYPTVDGKSGVQYVLNNSTRELVDFLPIGAATKNTEGKELTEMVDMSEAGAVAFSDGKYSIQNSGMLLRALQYSRSTGKKIIQNSYDKSLDHCGTVHEGKTSVTLGMEGIPSLSEYVPLKRDIELAEYAESSIIIHLLSTAKSVGLVEQANKNVFATVGYQNLIHSDEDLIDFDVNLKVFPPLRETTDKEALVNAIKKGIINAICTNHIPWDDESKKLEFSYAEYGAIGLETCYAALNTHLSKTLSQKVIVERLAYGPREILDLDIPEIKIGSKANLCLFDPSSEWEFTKKDIQSVSSNSPYVKSKFTGRVLGVINGRQSHLI